MSSDLRRKHQLFFKVLASAFILGFLVAVILSGIWRYHPDVFTSQIRVVAVALCPPFLLAGVLEATSDANATLALIMTIGTIVLANGFLYAGLASFVYFLATVFISKRRL